MGDLTPDFSKREYYCKCGRCMYSRPFKGDTEILRPKAVQDQLLRDYINGQEERDSHFQIRLKVNSGIRCPEWNRKWKGKDHSRHLPRFFFKLQGASDLSTTDIPARKLRRYTRKSFRLKLIPPGGCGLYWNFVHNDTSKPRYWGLMQFWKKP